MTELRVLTDEEIDQVTGAWLVEPAHKPIPPHVSTSPQIMGGIGTHPHVGGIVDPNAPVNWSHNPYPFGP